jgi:hypothetical protein
MKNQDNLKRSMEIAREAKKKRHPLGNRPGNKSIQGYSFVFFLRFAEVILICLLTPVADKLRRAFIKATQRRI